MADLDALSVTILSSDGLDTDELSATPAQENAASEGAIARSLSKLSKADQEVLRKAVAENELTLSQAIDRIKNRRARMASQKDILKAKKQQVAGGSQKVSALYSAAAPAVASSAKAADAIRLVKEASDLVYARMNEIDYKLALIEASDLVLASEQRELSGAMSTLDELVISLR